MPRALVLTSPWVDLTLSGESHRTYAAHPNPGMASLKRAAERYAPADQHGEALVSPLFADLAGLPATLVLDENGCELGVLQGPAEWNTDDGRAVIEALLSLGA